MGDFVIPNVPTSPEYMVQAYIVEGWVSPGTWKTFRLSVSFNPSRTRVVPYPVMGSFYSFPRVNYYLMEAC